VSIATLHQPSSPYLRPPSPGGEGTRSGGLRGQAFGYLLPPGEGAAQRRMRGGQGLGQYRPSPGLRPDPASGVPPAPGGSDFLGSVYLTLTEAVVDLKPVEPRDARVDVLGPQLGWQVLIVLSELISIRSVVVRHEDSVPVDPHVPLQSPEVRRGHVLRVPTRRGWSKPLAKPIDRRLSDQPHRHLAITNVEIACPCTIPTQCLVSIEEFLHMPSLGEFSGQLLNLVAIAGREECVEAVFLRPFPLPLDVLVERPGVAVLRRVCQLRGRI